MRIRRKVIGAVLATALVAVGGVALAAYLTEIDGSAAGAAQAWDKPTVATGTAEFTALLPGEAGAVSLAVTNPDDEVAVVIGSVTPVEGSVQVGDGVPAVCAGYIKQGATVAGALPTI